MFFGYLKYGFGFKTKKEEREWNRLHSRSVVGGRRSPRSAFVALLLVGPVQARGFRAQAPQSGAD